MVYLDPGREREATDAVLALGVDAHGTDASSGRSEGCAPVVLTRFVIPEGYAMRSTVRQLGGA